MKNNHIGHKINVGFICPNAYWEQFYKDSNDSQVNWDVLNTKINRMMKGEKI